MTATPGRFGGHLRPEFPSQLNVDVTEFCNLACVHCPYEAVTKQKGASRRHLSEAHHRKMVDEVVRDGAGHCRYLRYTGDGEPLIHPRLPELIADASARTGLPINLTTNGLLLDEDRARALLEAGVTVFDISLDAHTEATYAAVRVKGDLRVARANVLRLIALNGEAGRPARVVVSFVRQPLNEGEAAPFRAFWEQAGADQVVLRKRHSCAGSVPEMARELWERAPAARKPCLYPWERMVLGPRGDLGYCPADWLQEAKLANIERASIREIWQGPAMEALRAAHLSGDLSQHGFCGRCPDWSVIHWPGEGRSYADVMRTLSSPRSPGPRSAA